MIYSKNYITQFRDSSEDGMISLMGYMNFFQDAATSYMHELHKGNDTILEDYGCAWVYTKYRLEINDYCRIADNIEIKSWVSGQSRFGVLQEFLISSAGKKLAEGRLESYLIDMQTQKLCSLSRIAYPEDTVIPEKTGTSKFSRLGKKRTDDMEEGYSYKVLYTDLDKSRHMNNLKYVNLFLNSFTPDFYRENRIKVFEISYVGQSFFGDELTVFKATDNGRIRMTAVKQTGEAAASAVFELV